MLGRRWAARVFVFWGVSLALLSWFFPSSFSGRVTLVSKSVDLI